jgi:1-acyl-sn-glycerol-3-phosphate acyltransferase
MVLLEELIYLSQSRISPAFMVFKSFASSPFSVNDGWKLGRRKFWLYLVARLFIIFLKTYYGSRQTDTHRDAS